MTPAVHPRRIFGSIRFRLLLWGSAILVVVLAIFSGIVYYRQLEYQKLVVKSQLQSEAGYILETYQAAYNENSGREALSLATVFPELQDGLPKKLFVPAKVNGQAKSLIRVGEVLLMVDETGQVIGQAGGMDATDIAGLKQLTEKNRTGGDTIFMQELRTIDGEQSSSPYIFLATSTPLLGQSSPGSSDQQAILYLGAPFDEDGQLSRLKFTLALASSIVLSLSLVGGYVLTGRMMQPVQAITHTAQEINANDLTRRLNLGKQDELGELADTFDRMLDRLEEAFERQRQFTADASHELRTPLTIINLEVNNILDDLHSQPELDKSLRVIQEENERMTNLVNNLLVLARADEGSALLKREVLDISELTLDVVERLIPLSQRHDVIIVTGEMPPVMVQGDRFYLSLLVNNLVENAIKYGAGEERKVWIETGSDSSGVDSSGWLRVEDHGPGIKETDQPYLFERFYRVDPARSTGDTQAGEISESSDGHGLGLSIVQWIARSHGGDVRVTSQVGNGAIFEVILPLAGTKKDGKPM